MSQLDLTDIQGNILKGYRMEAARYTFLNVTDAAGGRRFVGEITSHVTTAEPWPEGNHTKVLKPDSTLNIAFTHGGLRALGVPAGSLASFPVPFQEGMKARATMLGDTGTSAPQHWDEIWQEGNVHIWISINAASASCLQQRYRWLEDLVGEINGVSILRGSGDAAATQDAGKLGGGKEHFGYRDGISNPDVAGTEIPKLTRVGKLASDGYTWNPLAAGEFLLGHRDEADELPPAPSPHLLGRNGTFMVYRKLRENVAAFRTFLENDGQKYPGGKELLAAKLVGRWRDGTPLSLSPEQMDPTQILDNDFTYADDPDGVKCPIGAHIRRANPRDAMGFGGKLANRHRIIRRGLPYGPPAPEGEPVSDDERGIIFMAMNASIGRQFEFVQREWLNFGNEFRQGNDKDPIAGDQDGTGKMVIAGTADSRRRGPHVCFGLPRFVDTRGGDYFFVPSMTALRKLAAGDLSETRPPQTGRPGMSFLEKLELLLTSGAHIPVEDPEFVKLLLFTMKTSPDEFFGLLRKHRPIFVAGRFAFVTRFEDVQEVLSRASVFHVPYEAKMKALLNDPGVPPEDQDNFMLGMGNTPQYQRDVSNMRIAARRGDVADWLVDYVQDSAEDIVANAGGRLDAVHDLTRIVPAHFVQDYFGAPWNDDRELITLANTMFQFLFIDLQNDPELGKAAVAAGKRTREHLDGIIRTRSRKSNRGKHDDVIERCLEMQDAQVPGMADKDIRNNLLGLTVGAVPTISKCAARALDYLLDLPADKLAAAQQAARDNNDEIFARYVFEALRFRPNNPGVFRFTLQDYVVARGESRATTIPQGTIVLAATQSAMFDEIELDEPNQFRVDRPAYKYMHFGYNLHTCFGEYISAVQIPGILKPLLQRNNLRRAAGDAGQLQWDSPLPSSRSKEFPSSLTVEWDV